VASGAEAMVFVDRSSMSSVAVTNEPQHSIASPADGKTSLITLDAVSSALIKMLSYELRSTGPITTKLLLQTPPLPSMKCRPFNYDARRHSIRSPLW
jgi:hypothetical protein